MLKATIPQIRLEAEPEDVGMSSQRLDNLTRLGQRYTDQGKLAGVVTAVARHGKVVHLQAQGQLDVESGRPMGLDTIFRLFSMTKPITSVALMTLYEEGLLQLDDPVARYVPEFRDLRVFVAGTPEKFETRPPLRPMTVRDALTHMTGIASGGPTTPGQLAERAQLHLIRGDGPLKGTLTLEDMIQRVAGLPLMFDPGTQWNYGISTDIVAYLCQQISGMRYDDFVRERVLAPLGMNDTGYMVPAADVHRFAACYRRGGADEAALVLSDAAASSRFTQPKAYFAGSGGLVSTVADYMRFCKMLVNGGELEGVRILGPRTLRYMTRNHLPGGQDLATMGRNAPVETSRAGTGFGLGFAVLLDPAAAQISGTPGEYYWSGAASTYFFVSPEDDLCAVLLTQLQPSAAYPLARQLRQTVYQALTD